MFNIYHQAAHNMLKLFSEEKIGGKDETVMSNPTVITPHQLNLHQLRLIWLLVTQKGFIHSCNSTSTTDEIEGQIFSFNAGEYASAFRVNFKDACEQLISVVEGLQGKKVCYMLSRETLKQSPHKEFIYFNWASYCKATHEVTIVFSALTTPNLKILCDPLIYSLLRQSRGANNGHAVKLYRNLKVFADVGHWAPYLEEFWEAMDVSQDNYRADFTNLRKRVIEPAVASINARTDLHVKWGLIRTRTRERKVWRLQFRFVKGFKGLLNLKNATDPSK